MNVDLKHCWETYRDTSTKPSAQEYVQLLKTLSGQFSKTFVLVDALDEFPEKERRLFVGYLMTLTPNIQVLVTSRGLLSIQGLFENAARMDIRGRDEDMRIALACRIDEEDFLADCVEQNPLLQDTIIDTIIQKAKEMFLVAELHITALSQEDNVRDLHDKLGNLPAEVADTYSQSLARIDTQTRNQYKRAHQVLLWLAYACRPIQVRELQQALAVRPNDTEYVSGGEPSVEALVSSCMGLVIVDGLDVRFVHYTAQEFFEGIRCQKYPNGQQLIAESCLNILSLSDLDINACLEPTLGTVIDDDSQELLTSFTQSLPVVRYAAQYWGDHARVALEADPIPSLEAAIRRLLKSPRNFVFSTWIMQLGSHYEHIQLDMSAPHVVAGFGITSMMKTAFEIVEGTQVDVRDAQGRTPLHMACCNGHVGVMNMLIERGANKNALDREETSCLDLAVRDKRKEVVESLLAVGVDMTIGDALSEAVYSGEDTITQMLLKNATDRNALKSQLSQVLIRAAGRGQESTIRIVLRTCQIAGGHGNWASEALFHVCRQLEYILDYGESTAKTIAVIRFLLDEGAAPNYEVAAPDTSWEPSTPLFCAACSLEAVELLVQRGALVNFQDRRGCTPLHNYSLTPETVHFFVSHGANVNTRDNRGQTPLYYAVGITVEVFSYLLDNDAEAEVQDEDGVTPLISAVRQIPPATPLVNRLLQAGASIEVKDKQGYTAFHYAMFVGDLSLCESLLEHCDTNTDRAAIQASSQADRTSALKMVRLYHSLAECESQMPSRWKRSPSDIERFLELWTQHERETGILLEEIGETWLKRNGSFLQLKRPASLGFVHVVKAFMIAGADFRTQGGDTLSEVLNQYSAWSPKANTIGILECLLDYGLPVNQMDDDGTALYQAAEEGLTEVAAFLLRKGADVELGGHHGSPLMVAACVGLKSYDISALLLDHNADIHKSCDTPVHCKWHNRGLYGRSLDRDFPIGSTAMHICATSSHTSAATIKLLVGHGADIEALTSSGETPLALAVRVGNIKTVKALLAEGADTTGPSSIGEGDSHSNG